MAYVVTHNRFAKGYSNKSTGTKMTWFKTNFNMPVPNIFDSGAIFDETEGQLDGYGVATSFDLTGFRNGWEIMCAATVFDVYAPFAGGNVTVSQTRKNPSGTILYSFSKTVTFPSTTTWRGYQMASNIGVAPREVSGNGTYTLTVAISGSGLSGSADYTFTISNHPGFSGYLTPRYIRVENDTLCYIDANGFKGKIVGNTVAISSHVNGYIRLETTSDRLTWIGSGDIMEVKRQPVQFASSFSNGATSTRSGCQPGYLRVDSEFGYTHLGFINKYGFKTLIGDGADPYA